MRYLSFVWTWLVFAGFQAMAADQVENVAGAPAKLAKPSTPIQEKVITYLIENGPKLLGAVLIIVAGLLAARWIGQLVIGWLMRRDLEPPVRMLITRLRSAQWG